LNVSLHNGQL